MTTPFAARDAKLSGAIEKAFGEQFTFTALMPQSDVNLPLVADGSKPAFTVVGVWEAPGDMNYPIGRGSNPDDEALRRVMQYPVVSVNKALLTWMPSRGCRCTRVFDGAVYEVAKVQPDDAGRVQFFLSSKMKP